MQERKTSSYFGNLADNSFKIYALMSERCVLLIPSFALYWKLFEPEASVFIINDMVLTRFKSWFSR